LILYITKNNPHNYEKYIKQYLKIRKKCFCDHHGWVKPNADGTETDHLDDAPHVYILFLDTQTDTVLGGARIVPSLGPTLMHSYWSDMLPDPDDFRSPNIWEVTRFCVDESSNGGRSKDFINRAFLALMVGILDFSANNGVSTLMAVCETRLVRMIQAFKGKPEVISTKTESDGCEISFVVWDANEELRESFEWARQYVGGTAPIKITAPEYFLPQTPSDPQHTDTNLLSRNPV